MKTRSFSAPRFKNVEAPRIKDNRSIQQLSPSKNMAKSAAKLHNIDNPEQSLRVQGKNNKGQEKHLQSKHYQNIAKKLDLGILDDANKSPIKIIAHERAKGKNGPQETFYGRKLEYPHSKKVKYEPNRQEENTRQEDIRRTQSVQTMRSKHFVDREVKSRKIKQQKADFDEKFRVAFDYLMSNNPAYLNQYRKICNQRARPIEQKFKMKLAPTLPTYTEHYPPKNADYHQHMDPQNKKTALGLGPRKVCGNSTSNEFHDGKYGPRADLATWPEGFKLQGPIDGTTTYANRFPNHGDYQKMVPVAKFDEIVSGMPFNPHTTHRHHFKGEPGNAADLAKWNNLHPYGNDFDPNRGTTYSKHHNEKEKQPIQQWPMYDPRHLKNDGKFSTEYKSELINQHNHDINKFNMCSCYPKDWYQRYQQ